MVNDPAAAKLAALRESWEEACSAAHGGAAVEKPLLTAARLIEAGDGLAKVIAALDAALSHHQRVPLYGLASTEEEPGNCPHDPERDWDCHFESDDGEWLCGGKPEGAVCSCTVSPDGERVPYPCDEVADILAALRGEVKRDD